jgi:tRNA pseudouridine38-40 synthase
MTHWKLILAYDGTPFHGWQVQPGLPTVQGLLADAIHRTVGESVLPQGSGRTDTGVHALGQVASFALAAPIPAANLQRALNRCLPPSIRILSAEIVPPDSTPATAPSARPTNTASSLLRSPTLEPRTFDLEPDLICPPTLAPYVWPCPWPLSISTPSTRPPATSSAPTTSPPSPPPTPTSQRADASEPPPPPVRTISHSQWHIRDGLLIYRVTATDSSTTWCATWSAPSFRPARIASTPTPSPPFSPPATAPLPAPPPPLRASSSSTSNTPEPHTPNLQPATPMIATAQLRIARLAATPALHRAFHWLHLHQPQLRQWQLELLRIPAPPFGEQARAAWFLERFQQLGLTNPHLDEAGNALAEL